MIILKDDKSLIGRQTLLAPVEFGNVKYEMVKRPRRRVMRLYGRIHDKRTDIDVPLSACILDVFCLVVEYYEDNELIDTMELLCGLDPHDPVRARSIIEAGQVSFDHIEEILENSNLPDRKSFDAAFENRMKARIAGEARYRRLIPRGNSYEMKNIQVVESEMLDPELVDMSTLGSREAI